MNIYEYDICDSDKGIILAESYERAVEIFAENYPDADPNHYDYNEIDKEYEYAALIEQVDIYNGGEKIVCIYS